MKLLATRCPLCGDATHFTVLYERNFSIKQIDTDVFSARRLPDKMHYRMVRCRRDGMVRSNPILQFLDLQKLYVESKFTYTAEVQNLTQTYMQALAPALARLPKKARILEIGCGNGFLLQAIKESGYPNVFGVEPSTQAVMQAPAWLRKRITVEMFSPTLFEKSSFDCIIIFQTLDHIPQVNVFMDDVATLLKKGGLFFSFHHNVESMSATLLGERSPIIDVEHTQLFSMHTSAVLLQQAGMRVLSCVSPVSIVSLRHLCWLFPFPRSIKKILIQNRIPLLSPILETTVPIRMGNVAILGEKQ